MRLKEAPSQLGCFIKRKKRVSILLTNNDSSRQAAQKTDSRRQFSLLGRNLGDRCWGFSQDCRSISFPAVSSFSLLLGSGSGLSGFHGLMERRDWFRRVIHRPRRRHCPSGDKLRGVKEWIILRDESEKTMSRGKSSLTPSFLRDRSSPLYHAPRVKEMLSRWWMKNEWTTTTEKNV